MIAYLKWKNVSSLIIVLNRGIGVLAGLTATMVSQKLISKVGLIRTGLWALWFQLTCLAASILQFFFLQYLTENEGVWIFMIGVSVSRFGLWLFDLCQTQVCLAFVSFAPISLFLQIVQENVENSSAGIFGGYQATLINFFDLVKYK